MVGRSDAEPRGGDAIDDQRDRQPSSLLVGCDILELRQAFQFRDKAIGPIVQFVRIGIFERVLILGAADAVIHRDVLHRLHVERDSLHLLQVGLQPADQIRGAEVAIRKRLQVDRHAAAVERRIGAVGADERGKTLDRRILRG